MFFKKIGKFVSVNNTVKCYIYDVETNSFTGESFDIEIKAKGFIGKGGMKIGEDGRGSLIFNNKKVTSDEMFITFDTAGKYGVVKYIANNLEFTNLENGEIEKINTTYEIYYSSDFSELSIVYIYQDGDNQVIGFAADSLEDVE